MRKSYTLLMTLIVLGGIGILLFMNVASQMGIVSGKYISPNDVRGVAVEHANKLYTLNFDQQNALIDIINHSVPVKKEFFDSRKTTNDKAAKVSKIVIYRFNEQPDIEITPVGFVRKTTSSDTKDTLYMVFNAPTWNKEGYLEETGNDDLNKLLLSTYDQ